MSGYIFLTAIVILICLCLAKLSTKLGLPILFAFILLGMFFGSDGVVKISFDNFGFAEQICSFALIFIMFYGGFGTNWNSAKPIVGKAVLLSSVGVALTAVITGLFCYFVLRVDFWESMLLGSIISSTDAASVFSILRSKRINLKDHTAPMLEVESGSNDPCSYMLTLIVLSIMNGDAVGWNLAYMVFAQVVFGILIGVAVALISHFVLVKLTSEKNGVDTIFVFSMALLSYAGSSLLGGNGYLSTYIAGIILGNRPLQNKKELVHFFDGITALMQILIFFLLGLLCFPSQMPRIVLPSLAIALFLTFVARPVAVSAILAPCKCSLSQQLLVSWSGVRGAASIVFAIMATVHPAYLKHDIFHMVFFIVLFSISIQGSLIPFLSKKLNMIDDNSNIMKTFSDYTDELPIQFIKLSVTEGHPWVDQQIKDITLLPELLLVLILRGKERIVPRGNTMILQGDILVVSTFSLNDDLIGSLTEKTIEADSDWLGKSLAEVKLGEDRLIVVIKREGQVIIPNGKTVIQKKDVLVLNQR